jgi:hypothetical protein
MLKILRTAILLMFVMVVNSFNLLNGKEKIGNPIANIKNKRIVKNKKRLNSLLGEVDYVDGFSQAFVGGTVGVMSVMFLLELRKLQDQNLEGCPYCLGNGEILCASCCGFGTVAKTTCNICNGRGLIICINCKGDGRITPIILQSRAIRNPEFATDNIGIDSP